jgi:hypothetical protein
MVLKHTGGSVPLVGSRGIVRGYRLFKIEHRKAWARAEVFVVSVASLSVLVLSVVALTSSP